VAVDPVLSAWEVRGGSPVATEPVGGTHSRSSVVAKLSLHHVQSPPGRPLDGTLLPLDALPWGGPPPWFGPPSLDGLWRFGRRSPSPDVMPSRCDPLALSPVPDPVPVSPLHRPPYPRVWPRAPVVVGCERNTLLKELITRASSSSCLVRLRCGRYLRSSQEVMSSLWLAKICRQQSAPHPLATYRLAFADKLTLAVP